MRGNTNGRSSRRARRHAPYKADVGIGRKSAQEGGWKPRTSPSRGAGPRGKMTDYNKWDKFVAQLSDDEDVSESPTPPPAAKVKKGNFRGNRMGTNATEKEYQEITDYSFEDAEGVVRVTIPLKGIGKVSQEEVRASFTANGLNLTLVGALITQAPVKHRLALPRLYAKIVPESSRVKVFTSGKLPPRIGACVSSPMSRGRDQGSRNEIVITLTKHDPLARWPLLSKQAHEKALIPKTINDYAFSNSLTSVTVYFKIPGLRQVPRENITVRFRVRSFDFEIHDHKQVRSMRVLSMPSRILNRASRRMYHSRVFLEGVCRRRPASDQAQEVGPTGLAEAPSAPGDAPRHARQQRSPPRTHVAPRCAVEQRQRPSPLGPAPIHVQPPFSRMLLP
eukprot:scaffold1765_cov385-Prasinococcus_capsulatus_cf.AAC.1